MEAAPAHNYRAYVSGSYAYGLAPMYDAVTGADSGLIAGSAGVLVVGLAVWSEITAYDIELRWPIGNERLIDVEAAVLAHQWYPVWIPLAAGQALRMWCTDEITAGQVGITLAYQTGV